MYKVYYGKTIDSRRNFSNKKCYDSYTEMKYIQIT